MNNKLRYSTEENKMYGKHYLKNETREKYGKHILTGCMCII